MTTTAIAQEAGVSVGALYRFFPDKHAIGQALADVGERFGAIRGPVDSLQRCDHGKGRGSRSVYADAVLAQGAV